MKVSLLETVMSLNKKPLLMLISIILVSQVQAQNTLSLEQTINIAKHNDLWLVENFYTQKSVESMSVAAGSLPDPKVSLAFLNYPTDTFNFGQEPMTQFKVGVSQMFPRGKTLQLKREQLALKSDVFPFQRLNRSAQVEVMATHLWLEAYKAQQSIALIEDNRSLFEQLSEVAESNYASAYGKTNQQDIVRAQLELTRLQDRLTQLKQKYDMAIEKLSQRLSDRYNENYANLDVIAGINSIQQIKLNTKLPDLKLKHSDLTDEQLLALLGKHPAIVALQQKIKVTEKGIDIAKQNYKPAWGVNASYGYRGESPTGINRADFLTVGVSFDVPIFTKNRQDKKLESAVAINDAVQSEEYQMLKQMLASYKTAWAQLQQLNQRQHLYKSTLLPQMHEQAEASLNAYTNDAGDFSEVVRARIAELNALIDALNIDVNRQKTIAQLNYFSKQV